MKLKISDVVLALILLAILVIIIFPPNTTLMDFLLIINMAVCIIILLFSLYIKDPVDFSVFPTVLLFITVFRLGLNLASTRLILGNEGDAGQIIAAFGQVVVGGNLAVGIIAFIVILIVQFMVITKGAERVAEVSARFTLDAMPGKQMAIDADLNSGFIDENQARERRQKIQDEADFHGAMDGASKFIKGDAIAGLLITFINAIGGIVMGVLTMDEDIGEIAQIFTLATIGDGLITQIPALLVSTASGIIITRSGGEGTFGSEMSRQILSQPHALIMGGILLILVSLMPGLPTIPMWVIAIILMVLGYIVSGRIKKEEVVEEHIEEEVAAEEKRKPESVTALLQVDPIELEFGYGIVPMVDVSQGGDLLDRVVMIRRQCAIDMGVIVPAIRLRDNIQLGTNEYSIKIKGVEIAKGEVMADHLLALSSGEVEEEIYGIPTVEPTFGLPALWIPKSDRDEAEILGYSTVDPPSVIATHLTEIIKRYGHELLNRQQVQTLVDNLKKTQPALVDEVVPKLFSLGEIQKILANLLSENIPIRDMASIIEALGDYGTLTRDPDMLTEYVRQALKRSISKRFIPEDVAYVITLDPSLEQLIIESTKQSEHGSYLAIEPTQVHSIFDKLRAIIENMKNKGRTPVILTSPLVRRQFRKIAEQISPELAVLSYNEIDSGVEVLSEGTVSLQ
ncbi:MAG: flagellar biosynthesis protein FlhA [Oscillospiraceae bacterium]|nr:flagellar biosynthesis protein FlhA [Oscillospiraceae bacterium]MCL2278264.1 flagellar biosynthesis protein FlhA [Oscillospiraceae bacterium]